MDVMTLIWYNAMISIGGAQKYEIGNLIRFGNNKGTFGVNAI